MIPSDERTPATDPRALVLRGRENELFEKISGTGYVPTEEQFSDFCQSLKAGRAWLISGTRGSGKTAFPEAVAAACNLNMCIVAGRDGLKQEEILYGWDEVEQSAWMRENLEIARTLPENERADFIAGARRAKWRREYLILGEMGMAYDLAAKAAQEVPTGSAPPLLLLDESDKFGAPLEDAMLMPLDRGVMYVPRLEGGFIGISDWERRPIVVTTSNDLRHKLSAPFVSRHLYSHFKTPSLSDELKILHSRCPRATPPQLALVAKLLDGVRGIAGLEDYPSLRESIDLLNALVRDRLETFDERTIARYFCYFVKSSEAKAFLRLQLDYLLLTATGYHPLIDDWLSSSDAGGANLSPAGEANFDSTASQAL